MKGKNVTLLKLIIKVITLLTQYICTKKKKNPKQHKPELQEVRPFKNIYNQCTSNHKQAFLHYQTGG